MIQLAGGSGAGYQENLCGYGAFTASGRLVDSAGRSGAGKGGGQRGGAAAVQAYGGGAAQLQQPLCQKRFGGADTVAALAAVNGVKNSGAIVFQANGGAGGSRGIQAADHLPVFNQLL